LRDITNFKLLNVFGQDQIEVKLLALLDDSLWSKKVGEFYDVVDIVVVFEMWGLVDHTYVIEDIIFS
jgi:hypothetical protein